MLTSTERERERESELLLCPCDAEQQISHYGLDPKMSTQVTMFAYGQTGAGKWCTWADEDLKHHLFGEFPTCLVFPISSSGSSGAMVLPPKDLHHVRPRAQTWTDVRAGAAPGPGRLRPLGVHSNGLPGVPTP